MMGFKKFLYRRLPTGQGVGVLAVTTAALLAAGPAAANLDAAYTTNADQLWSGGGLGLDLTGAGVTVGVWEAPDYDYTWQVLDTHETFASYNPNTGNWDGPSRVTFFYTPSNMYSGHATAVAGTIGGAHRTDEPQAWGMAPGVDIVSYNSSNDTTTMLNAQVNISNHSYGETPAPWQRQYWNIPVNGGGTQAMQYDTWQYDWDTTDEDPQYGQYTDRSRSLDLVLAQRPKLLSFWAAGNAPSDGNNSYSDIQRDGRFVTRFSQPYIDFFDGDMPGLDLGNRYYLFNSAVSYPTDAHGLEPGGYDSLTGYATAKNNVVVGSVNDFTDDPHEAFKGNIVTSWFSSYGPTDDGRLGVDLVANGQDLYTADAGSDTSYQNGSGTSLSSPNAAGTAALILEHWRNENGGYTPDSATQKGLLMHTATDATSYGYGPDYATGYGLIDAAEAVGHITEAHNTPEASRDRHIWESTLSDGELLSLDLLATSGEFKASLSWLDPAAPVGPNTLDDRTPNLVNDLDIWVVDGSGNTLYSWVLDPENPDADATRDGHNRVDNFTQVFKEAGQLTQGDDLFLFINHIGSLDGGSQDFALIVSGALLNDDGTPSDFTPVPEPGSLALLGLGGMLVLRRRRG